MKVCITILILSLSLSLTAAEHKVVRGDSLWKLSSQYLGCGSKWKQVTYSNGSIPDPKRLIVGRTVLFNEVDVPVPKAVKAVVNVSNGADVNRNKPKEAKTITSLSFNTSVYCCSQDIIRFDSVGEFAVSKESHPFYLRKSSNPKTNMATFMNIKISEELINAIDNN